MTTKDEQRVSEHALEVAAERSRVLPVLRHLRVVIDDRKVLGQAQIEVVVLGEAKPLIEAADRDERFSPVDRRGHDDPAAADERGVMFARDARTSRGRQRRTVGGDAPLETCGERRIGPRGEGGHADRRGMWQEPVVGIEKDHVASGARLPARVAGGGQTAIQLPKAADRRMTRRDRRRVVGRAIVDHDDLDRGIRLCDRGYNRLVEKVRLVVARDDDRQQIAHTCRSQQVQGP